LFAGGQINVNGNIYTHTFTSSGALSPSPDLYIPGYITAIGGGGAGGADAGGGGGGGGTSYGQVLLDTTASYLVVVGRGGVYNSQPGQASYVNGFPIIAYGGSGGGSVYDGYAAGGSASGGAYNANGGLGGTGARGGNPYGQPGQKVGTISGAGGGSGELDGNDGSPVPGGSGGGLAGAGGSGAGWNVGNNTGGFPYGGGGGGGRNYGGWGAYGAAGIVTVSYTSSIQRYNGGSVSSSGAGATTHWTHTFTVNGQLIPIYITALPTGGPLSLSLIQSKFGGNAPISLSEYYKGGSYVTGYSYAPHVPVSGTIKISDFYGSAQYIPQVRTLTLTDGQTWTVPPTIASTLYVTLQGSSGGNGGNDASGGYPGYPGHLVNGYVIVSPGDIILASVGDVGIGGGSGTGPGTGGQGGYGGVLGFSGGSGGWCGTAGWSGGGGGGGGATVIAKNGTPVGVAAGGGGGGGGGWHSGGRPSQGYQSNGTYYGGAGQNKDGHDGNDGGGGGGGGGGYLGGAGGATYSGDEGAWSGSDGADLIPAAGSATVTYNSPRITIQGTW
jgi:hypothetical protein